jgi:hypothetical protein
MFNSAAFSAPPFRKARVCVCWCPDLRNGKLLSKQSYVVTGWTLATVQLETTSSQAGMWFKGSVAPFKVWLVAVWLERLW